MQETTGVTELHGFEVVEGDPDVRGWEVIDRNGQRVGEVAELLADPENPSARYLDVRLDSQTGAGHPVARPTGTLDVERDSIPELDPLSDEGGVIGQAAVPGDGPPEMPARTVGEALVRDSLLEIENRMTAGEGPGFDHGGRRALIPAGQAHLEPGGRRVRIDSLPPS